MHHLNQVATSGGKLLQEEQRLLRAEEVAQVSRSFAYQSMQRGEVPVVRLGRAVRSGDLESFIDDNLVGGSVSLQGVAS
jgi:predicted DNA-binding transcriptional regulator AlpA